MMNTQNSNAAHPTRKRVRPKSKAAKPSTITQASGSEEYEIGYGRPPKHSQFAKGQSGNKKGRPRGSKNAGTIANEMLNKKIPIRENGEERNMTAREAMILAQRQKALRGDIKAFQFLLNISNDAAPDIESNEWQMSDEERKVLARFIDKIPTGTDEGQEDDPA